MKTLEELNAMIEGGQSVILNGEHINNVAALEAAYNKAKATESAAPATIVASPQSQGEVVTRADLDALRAELTGGSAPSDMVPKSQYDLLEGKIKNDYVTKSAHDQLKAKIKTDYIPKTDAETLAARNSAQADLLDALIGEEADLKKLTLEQLRAVAKFEGVEAGETREDALGAILGKRSG